MNNGLIIYSNYVCQSKFASGDNNSALTYRKAAAAIRDLDYQVTDGKALTRPKTKVAGIGKKIGDLICAFLETGKYQSYLVGWLVVNENFLVYLVKIAAPVVYIVIMCISYMCIIWLIYANSGLYCRDDGISAESPSQQWRRRRG